MKIYTKKYHRDFLVGRGRGFECVRWWAWRESRPNVRGYGETEEGAINDLVRFVQPLNTDNSAVSVADDA